MSKATFTLGNAYCLARGKKDALVMAPAAKPNEAPVTSTAINLVAGADSLGGGKKVYITLETIGGGDGDQIYVLDPSKGKGGISWSKSLSLSGNQSFKINIMDGRAFGIGSSFGLSYKNADKVTKYLSFGQGAEPLPKLSEESDHIMRFTVTNISTAGSEGSESGDSDNEEGSNVAAVPTSVPATSKSTATDAPPPPPQPPSISTSSAGSSTQGDKEISNHDGGVDVPYNNMYVIVFSDGPLGVKLKRSRKGELLVQDIVPNSQAVGKGIELGDKFCVIGRKNVGDHPIEDDEFNSIVSIIREHERPLSITFEHMIPHVDKGAVEATTAAGLVAAPPEEPMKLDAAASSPEPSSSPQDEEEAEVTAHHPPPTQQDIDDMNALRRLANRLVLSGPSRSPATGGLAGLAAAIGKPRTTEGVDNGISDSGRKESFVLVQDGRRIVKHGEIDVLGRGTLWNARNNKYIFLLSDVILVTAVKGKNFHLETVVNHNACKLDPSPRDPAGGKPDPNRFDIRGPGGVVELIFKDIIEKEVWSRALSDAICHTVFMGKDTLSFGWRHMYIHGSLHSAVLARDEAAVRSIIAACEDGSLDISVLDERDEDMYTPLHFACILRQPKIAELLLNSHVDCTVPDRIGRTAFHWCAAQLDFETLELLCDRVFDVDILDDRERTPLYIACVEGRDAQGQTCVKTLSQIITLLTTSGASVNVVDEQGLSPLHYVSASLQFAAVAALLKAKALVNIHAANELAWTPLHYACSCRPLKRACAEGYLTLHPGGAGGAGDDADKESIYISDVGRTIGILLGKGSWPNVRAGKSKVTPLQVLVLADGLGDPLFQIAASLLVTSGARVGDGITGPISKNQRYLDFRDELLKCHDEWSHRGQFDAISLALCPGAYLPIGQLTDDNSSSALSSDVVCGPCGAGFTMIKRKHTCRLCEVTCCDECSKKRVSLGGNKEVIRCCDGCFNRVFDEVEEEKRANFLANFKPAGKTVPFSSEDDTNRKILFGDTSDKPDRKKSSDSKVQHQKASVASTENVMAEARQNLEKRGEKLEQLADKTDKLANASSEFADMAKQLRQQNQKPFSFWG